MNLTQKVSKKIYNEKKLVHSLIKKDYTQLNTFDKNPHMLISGLIIDTYTFQLHNITNMTEG